MIDYIYIERDILLILELERKINKVCGHMGGKD